MPPAAMDLEPIYCAEQISVPPDLADILKAYTKEVVRRQPEDMLEFSAIYFANLANVSGPAEDTVPPSVSQLKAVFAAVKGQTEMAAEEFVGVCVGAGVSQATIEQTFRLGEFAGDTVNPKEPLVLLLTMTDASFLGIVTSLFEVFGEEDTLSGAEFLGLFKYLTAKDTSVRAESVAALEAELDALAGKKLGFHEVNDLAAFHEIVDAGM
mmetsp:Transcript_10394/g.16618  ORF Transcript_10394/g.16618 Transcript_10394/m.16618 type:complete len:210 (-) Transcript_10394:191-820(-)